jgi:DNA-binding CsgD family transcriptional regulator
VTTELVGRDRELATLLGWIRESAAGTFRVVLVAGDAGIGKTSLATAAAEVARRRGGAVAWGRTTEAADAPSFRPWRQVLHATGAPDLLGPSVWSDPEVDRFTRFDAVTDHLALVAERDGGLLVVLEDVHLADGPSLQLLRHVAEATATASRLCVLVTSRERVVDESPLVATTLNAVARLPGCRRLRLESLEPAQVAALVGDDMEAAVIERVVEVSGGNPLLAGELSRHIRSGGDPERVPATVIDAVRARLLERSDACVDVLRVAAVIGRDFSAGLVATALGWPVRTCLDAIDEAMRSGFVDPSGEPGRFLFIHALIRDGVEATLGATDLAETNRQVAAAIEAFEGTGDEVVADLARHWQAAAVLGHRTIAAEWCERAAQSADRRMAWEDAARLFDRAVELPGADADPIDRHRRLVAAAAAQLNSGDISEAVERCEQAAASVRHLGRGDLLAAAALVVEGRGGPPLSRLRYLAVGALEHDGLDAATRARLLGQLAACAFYLDPSQVEHLSEASLAAAKSCGDPLALVAAARARQMAMSGPESAPERLHLATVIGDAGRALGRASVLQWEPIWRIDALVELGRLPEAIAELAELRRCVGATGLPVSRWHLLRIEALLAQATGRFADALESGTRCCELYGRMEDPLGGRAMLAGFQASVAMHTGFDEAIVAAWDEIDLTLAPPFLGDLPLLGPLIAALGVGDDARALALYDRLAPATAWTPPRFLLLHLLALRLWAAVRLQRFDDVDALVKQLSRHRGTHIAAGAGGLTYTGPVEVWTGIGSAALGRLDEAIDDLDEASRCCGSIAAPAFAVQARVELARALAARGNDGDHRRARAILDESRPTAATLGMKPWVEAIDELAARLAPRPAETAPLSPREREVAALVADGLTNRAIAARLYVSERTAQNHVQHILTKLGLANRAQIATWFATTARSPAASRPDG